jgi:DNA-binding NtrC family response regulator
MADLLKLLLVDDDAASLHLVERFIETEGFEVTAAQSAEEAEELALQIHPHVLITDVVLPGMDGFMLLARLKEKLPQLEVILLTGHASVERAVEAIRDGASDYIEKPVNRSRLLASIRKVKQQVALRLENLELKNKLNVQAKDLLVGHSPKIEEIRRTIERIASGNMNVFIEGESGTGKEVVAEMLHRLGTRMNEALIKVSCAAIPDNLLESEMFGYEKGAFTGAMQSKPGKFELAHRGTLFLDEIGEMSPPLQAKFLRVLQDGQFSRLGGNDLHAVDVRVVAATNIKVEKAITEGKFREDLYYRLNVVRIQMPPLRERLDDIPFLVAHFLGVIRRKLNLNEIQLAPEAIEYLQTHSWPGNVRELANTIERAVALRQGNILKVSDFTFNDRALHPVPNHANAADSRKLIFDIGTPLEEIESQMIRAAIEAAGGDKEKAAAMLGISARTIYRKLGEV